MYTRLSKLTRILILFCLLASFAGDPTISAARNPTAPKANDAPVPILEQVDQFGGWITDIAKDGDIIYVSAGQHVYSVDFSDPAAPILIGQSRLLPDVISAIDFKGEILYAAAGSAGVMILDISDPSAPVVVNTIPAVDAESSLTVTGDLLLVQDGTQRLLIFDISNPLNPAQVGVYEVCPSCIATGVADISVQNDLVFLNIQSGFSILSIADPTHPVLVSTFFPIITPISGKFPILPSLRSVIVSGQYTYANFFNWDTTIVDISNPASPQQVNTISGGQDIAFYANRLYVGTLERTYIYNITDPNQWVFDNSFGESVYRLFSADRYLFSSSQETLSVWDLADPVNPLWVSDTLQSSFSSVYNLTLSGN